MEHPDEMYPTDQNAGRSGHAAGTSNHAAGTPDHAAGTPGHTTGQDASAPSDIRNLIDDISYLMDEADALASLIGLVPFDEDPGDGYSIFRWLKLIDFAQTKSIEPLIRGRGQTIDKILYPAEIEEVFDRRSNEFESLSSEIGNHTDEFDGDAKESDIQALLKQIRKNRAHLTARCKELLPAEWSLPVELHPHQTERLQDVVREWIRWERRCLKKMADRVLVYQKEMHSRREILHKQSSRRGDLGTRLN